VIAIIGLLSTIAVVGLGPAKINARNATRKANLVQISKALELYYNDNGGYPANGGGSANFHGACTNFNGPYPDTGASAWIPNFSSYMAQLPHDQNTNKGNANNGSSWCLTLPGNNCYLYSSDGKDYKVLVNCLVEGPIGATDPFLDWRGYDYQISTAGAVGW
jgi:type II secretory pathway pseudopilin PulG